MVIACLSAQMASNSTNQWLKQLTTRLVYAGSISREAFTQPQASVRPGAIVGWCSLAYGHTHSPQRCLVGFKSRTLHWQGHCNSRTENILYFTKNFGCIRDFMHLLDISVAEIAKPSNQTLVFTYFWPCNVYS